MERKEKGKNWQTLFDEVAMFVPNSKEGSNRRVTEKTRLSHLVFKNVCSIVYKPCQKSPFDTLHLFFLKTKEQVAQKEKKNRTKKKKKIGVLKKEISNQILRIYSQTMYTNQITKYYKRE